MLAKLHFRSAAFCQSAADQRQRLVHIAPGSFPGISALIAATDLR